MQSSRRAWLLRSVAAGFLLAGPALGEPAEPPSVPADASEHRERTFVSSEPDRAATPAEHVILIARTPGDDGVVTRLRAELQESDWLVLEVRFDERAAPSSLAAVAERERASAAVRVHPRRGVIELWVLGSDGAVEETLSASGERRSEAVLALRVVEALRARGLRIEKPPREEERAPVRAAEVRVPPPVDEQVVSAEQGSSSDTRLWLELGAGLVMSPGGLAAAPGIEAGARLELASRWSFGMTGFIPITNRSLAGPEGEARVATWRAGGTLELAWGRFAFGGFRSGIGAGAVVTTMFGDADEGYAGASDTVVAFAPEARSSFYVELGRAVALRAGLAVGATIPEVSVAFGEREAATWGRPFVLASIAVEASP